MTCDRARRDELYWAFTGEERFYDDDDTDVELVVQEEGVQDLVKDKSESLFCIINFISVS